MPLRTLLLLACLARVGLAQSADTTHRVASATISGVVWDSLARSALDGAAVQLVAADSRSAFARAAISDAAGRFRFDSVPPGRYTLGFFHPLLDTLGVSAPLREVVVAGPAAVRADLAIPSPSRLQAAICRSSAADSGALLVGTVRDARDRAPAAGAKVAVEWLEISFTSTGVVHHAPRRVVTTGENGWFAVCNVPAAGTISLIASRGADSTDRVDVEVPPGHFLRHELYLGPSRTVAVVDSTPHADSAGPRIPRRVHVGDGRLSGTVVTVTNGQPVVGAQVRVADGTRTRTNERGEWSLTGIPAGTRILEVRSVGYYPERRAVDVISDAPPIRTSLFTLKAVLDTVRVNADRLRASIDATGFELRRRSSGTGRFISTADIARSNAFFAVDLLRRVPGVTVDDVIKVRGAFGDCSPELYFNGAYVPPLSSDLEPDDINMLVTNPKEITGIEIYHDQVPPQFSRTFNGCGAIVIWTR